MTNPNTGNLNIGKFKYIDPPVDFNEIARPKVDKMAFLKRDLLVVIGT